MCPLTILLLDWIAAMWVLFAVGAGVGAILGAPLWLTGLFMLPSFV